MRYSIYKNVEEHEFEALKERLNNIERVSSPLMQMHNFYLNRDSYEDTLALDYLYKDEIFFGNIGLTYIDKEKSRDFHLFEFYITKSYDKGDQRFYKKIVIEKKYTLDKVSENIYKLFKECLLMYESIRNDEIIESIKLRR